MSNNTKVTSNKNKDNKKTTGEENADTTFTRKLKPPEIIEHHLKKSLNHNQFHNQRGDISPFRVHPH